MGRARTFWTAAAVFVLAVAVGMYLFGGERSEPAPDVTGGEPVATSSTSTPQTGGGPQPVLDDRTSAVVRDVIVDEGKAYAIVDYVSKVACEPWEVDEGYTCTGQGGVKLYEGGGNTVYENRSVESVKLLLDAQSVIELQFSGHDSLAMARVTADEFYSLLKGEISNQGYYDVMYRSGSPGSATDRAYGGTFKLEADGTRVIRLSQNYEA